MTEPEAHTLELDCRGRPCPAPIIELGRQVSSVEVGGLIAVAADDPAAAIDVPAWCRIRGQEYVGARTDPDGVPIYVVRRIS